MTDFRRDRLLAADRDSWKRLAELANARASALQVRINVAVALHQPHRVPVYVDNIPTPCCGTCLGRYPCATIRALTTTQEQP